MRLREITPPDTHQRHDHRLQNSIRRDSLLIVA
jgi:hypothetical protein